MHPKPITFNSSSLHTPPARRRILIVDDHPLMRRGLTALIDNEPDLIVCAAVGNPQEGIEAIAALQPDLVITDLSMRDGEGLALIACIRSDNADLLILVLTIHDAPFYVRRTMSAGANGYVSKQELGETLLIAVRCVLGGETYLSPQIRAELADKQPFVPEAA